MRTIACALVLAPLLVACSSDDAPSDKADASAMDSATEGSSTLPTCVGEGGFQCQPKGCLSGFVELAGYDCGNSGGSCCGKRVPSLDAGSDTSADAKSD